MTITEPMTAERRAEIRARIEATPKSIAHPDVADLLAEVDRLRALWAAVAKTSQERKAEADGRRQYAEELKAENERLRKELAEKSAEVDDKSEVGHAVAEAWTEEARRYAGNADYWRERTEAAEAERDRLDVRIDEISAGFAKASHLHPSSEDGNLCTTCKRPYPCPTVKALIGIDDHASEVIAERDQLKAANDRVRALHVRCEGHTRDCDDCLGHNNVCSWCGDPYPCATIAAIDQPADSAESR